MTGLAPWLSVPDATAALVFYRAAFGAVDVERHEFDGVVQVAQLWIGGADFWIQNDPDAVFARAIRVGATEVYAMQDAHGWHIGRMVDPFGHHWEIGRRLDG